jgi:hypothetical protein
MKSPGRLLLILSCALVGALEAPRALRVLAEDVRGPYQRTTSFLSGRADVAHAPVMPATGRTVTERNANALDGKAAVVTIPTRR